MTQAQWEIFLTLLWPHLTAVALVASRLVPISFLCPVLGGPGVPVTVRLGLVLSLSLALHLEGGVAAPPMDSAWALGALSLKEVLLGVAIGLVASLPFEAARMGGRFIDLLRGTSAEAALPGVGNRESATGEGLYRLIVALAVTGVAYPLILSSLWRSFGVVGLGARGIGVSLAMQLASLVVGSLGTALAIGAPVAGLTLGIDFLLGVLSKAAAPVGFQDLAAPAKILGGGALLWLGLGVLANRLLEGVTASSDFLVSALQVAQ